MVDPKDPLGARPKEYNIPKLYPTTFLPSYNFRSPPGGEADGKLEHPALHEKNLQEILSYFEPVYSTCLGLTCKKCSILVAPPIPRPPTPAPSTFPIPLREARLPLIHPPRRKSTLDVLLKDWMASGGYIFITRTQFEYISTDEWTAESKPTHQNWASDKSGIALLREDRCSGGQIKFFMQLATRKGIVTELQYNPFAGGKAWPFELLDMNW